MAPTMLKHKSASLIATKYGKFPAIASWLEKAQLEDETEHNIEREHHNWTSEPELWLYQPGLEPGRRRNRSGIKRDYQSASGRKNSIESPSSDDLSDDHELRAALSGSNTNTDFKNSYRVNGMTPSGRKSPLSMKTSNAQAYNRKVHRRHKMKYGKKLQSSKSDSYHKKYMWDMVFHERAVVALQEEFRILKKQKKLEKKRSRGNAQGRGYPSMVSMTSGDDCSHSEISKKVPISAAAAAAVVGNMHDLLLRSASQRGSENPIERTKNTEMNSKDKRKISQTGSALFAHVEMKMGPDGRSGRHPAKSSSKDDSDLGKRTNVLKRGVLDQQPNDDILDSLDAPPGVSLKNNNNSVGGTDSYNMSSGQTGMTSVGYPGYPSIPYMDPLMIQAFMMQGMYNPMMVNYNYQQQNAQNAQNAFLHQQQQNTLSGVQQANSQTQKQNAMSSQGIYTSAYPSAMSMYPNMSSSSGGYPAIQQDLINQLNAGIYQQMFNKNTPSSPATQNANIGGQNPTGRTQTHSRSISQSPAQNGDTRSANLRYQSQNQQTQRTINNGKESSEESEDIRPSRHAIDDKTNDLHPKKAHSKKAGYPSKYGRTLTKDLPQSFDHNGNTAQGHGKITRTRTGHHDELTNFSAVGEPVHPLTRGLSAHAKKGGENHTLKPNTTPYSNSTLLSRKKEPTSKHVPRASVINYLSQLKICVETLKFSGWYWGNISGENAMSTVEKQGLGAFLIRDSTHQKFLFTLTVHTSNGPTNVRIVYRQGLFGLDCDSLSQTGIKFDCVVKMISHYVNNSKKYKRLTDKNNAKKQLTDLEEGDNQDEKKETTAPTADQSIALLLLSPCKKEVQSLRHLARLAINKKMSKKSSKTAGITLDSYVRDDKLLTYCKRYPYTV